MKRAKNNGAGVEAPATPPIARGIQSLAEDCLTHVLDRVRQSDMGERQLTTFERSVREFFNTRLVALEALLEAQGVLRKCGCLADLLAADAEDLAEQDSEAWQGLVDARRGCRRCQGTGYVNTVNLRVVKAPAGVKGAKRI